MRNISRSIATAGFSDDYEQWHIAKHDVYGQRFKESWLNKQADHEVSQDSLEEEAPDDDLFDFILDDIEDLVQNINI